jgi:hypothetical protein
VRLAHTLLVLGAVCLLFGGGCKKECPFLDPICCATDELPPIATIVNVGLFLDDPRGEPLCTSEAVITLRQDEDVGGMRMNPYTEGVLGEDADGHFHLVYRPAEEPCNLYDDDSTVIWRHCASPMEYEVQVPGCDPVQGVRTWDDNYLPGRGTDISWHIPVVLTCAERSDGGVAEDGGLGADGGV